MSDSDTKPQFTPGPWYVDPMAKTVVRPGNEEHPRRAAIAKTGLSHGLGDARGYDEANARIIAAAPDLYEALKELMRLKALHDYEWKTADEKRDYAENKPKAWEAARVALAKAGGKE